MNNDLMTQLTDFLNSILPGLLTFLLDFARQVLTAFLL